MNASTSARFHASACALMASRMLDSALAVSAAEGFAAGVVCALRIVQHDPKSTTASRADFIRWSAIRESRFQLTMIHGLCIQSFRIYMEFSEFKLRLATSSDIPALHALIEASVHGLHAKDYTPSQIEGALGTVLGIDTQLITDQTYFIAELSKENRIAACGGWSKRKTLFGADRGPGREPELLNPATDAAKVRAIFVHPTFPPHGPAS